MPNGSSSAYYNSVLQHSVQQSHQGSQSYFGHVPNRNNASGHRYNKAHHHHHQQQQQHDVSNSNALSICSGEVLNRKIVDSSIYWAAISWKSAELWLVHGALAAFPIAIVVMVFMRASIAPQLHRMAQSHRNSCDIQSTNEAESHSIHDCNAIWRVVNMSAL